MTSDLNQLKVLYRKSVEAFIKGDRNAQKPMWSERDDVTLANPPGPPAKGYDQVCQVTDSASALPHYRSKAGSIRHTAEQGHPLGPPKPEVDEM
jgi:hypothetical protein